MKVIHWETTDPFHIEWLSTTEVDFYKIGHLTNSLNEDQAVLVGKDGQEIEQQCGRLLLREMENVAEMAYERQSRPSYRGGYRGRGTGYRSRGSSRGGRGSHSYIKQERD